MATETRILESIVVDISAPAMSLMLYDNCNSEDQSGFLLGTIFRTEGVVRERNRNGVHVALKRYKFYIKITGAIVCPEINLYKISSYPKNIPRIPNIVGWFTRRELITTNPINPLKLTFTEKLIHKNLTGLSRFNKLPFFTGCVLDTYKNSSKNVHSYDIKFFQLNHENRIQEVELENSISELKSYNVKLFLPRGTRQDFNKLCHKDNGNFKENYDQYVDKSIEKLAVAESNMFILLKEIKDISKDIEQLQNGNKTQKQQKKRKIPLRDTNKPSWVTKLEAKRLYRNS